MMPHMEQQRCGLRWSVPWKDTSPIPDTTGPPILLFVRLFQNRNNISLLKAQIALLVCLERVESNCLILTECRSVSSPLPKDGLGSSRAARFLIRIYVITLESRRSVESAAARVKRLIRVGPACRAVQPSGCRAVVYIVRPCCRAARPVQVIMEGSSAISSGTFTKCGALSTFPDHVIMPIIINWGIVVHGTTPP